MSEPTHRFDARMALYSAVRKALKRTSSKRYGDWLEKELIAVADAANRWVGRSKETDLRVISLEQVRRLDAHATGSDWGSKLPLYVSEYVFGLREVPS